MRPRRPIVALLHTIIAICAVPACSPGDPCVGDSIAGDSTAGVSIVLTFDDGPVPADIADPQSSTLDELMQPLAQILDVLDERAAAGLFYIKGPGHDEAADALLEFYTSSIEQVRDRGHALGYHAFDHQAEIWLAPLAFFGMPEIRADLDRLELFLDQALEPLGLSREVEFEPIFRQPFGGFGINAILARIEAFQRGWTYRGFLIDSVDWANHPDVDPALVAALPVETEADHVALVLEKLRQGAARNSGRMVVDVLLHVNDFTAEHLGEWIDELDAAFSEETGAPVTFDVPRCYLEFDDFTVDRSFIFDLITAGPGE